MPRTGFEEAKAEPGQQDGSDQRNQCRSDDRLSSKDAVEDGEDDRPIYKVGNVMQNISAVTDSSEPSQRPDVQNLEGESARLESRQDEQGSQSINDGETPCEMPRWIGGKGKDMPGGIGAKFSTLGRTEPQGEIGSLEKAQRRGDRAATETPANLQVAVRRNEMGGCDRESRCRASTLAGCVGQSREGADRERRLRHKCKSACARSRTQKTSPHGQMR